MAITRGGGSTSGPKIQDSTKNNKVELNTGSNQVEFTTGGVLTATLDSSGNLNLLNAGNIISAGAGSGASGIEVIQSTASTDFGLKLRNNSNGDIKLTMETAAQSFSFGIDNSDGDKLKLSASSTDVGTSTLWQVLPDGSLGLGVSPTSKLDVDGSITATGLSLSGAVSQSVTSITSATTLDDTHSVVHVDGTSGAFTLALPASAGISGRSYIIQKVDASANAITIDPNASETINGVSTLSLDGPYDWVAIRSDGTNWLVEGTNNPTESTISLEDGSAAAPSLKFDSDIDSGLFLQSAGDLGLTTDGVLRFGISSAGMDFNSLKGINLADPVNPQDAATLASVNSGLSAQNLNDHNDVNITLPATGALLKYDGAEWIDSPVTIDTNNTIIAVNGTAADPSLAFVGGTNTGIYYRTGPSALIVCQAGNDVAEFSASEITFRYDLEFDFGGSAAAPNISLDSDNTTGIAFPGSGQVHFSSGGSLMARITSSAFDMNSNSIINVANPSSAQDAMTLNYADANYQPLDAGLTSISGLTTAADQMIYTTALDSYSTTSLTALARSLLADATESEMRDTLQLNAGQAGDIWVEKAGDTMTGLLTLSGDPTAALHSATKQYVDALASGLDPKASCKGATSSDIGGTYNSTGGTGGSGEFTNVDLTSDAIFDGVPTASTYAIGDRICIQDQTTQTQNGIYVVTTAGATGVIERATDHDGTPSNEVSSGNTTFIELGTVKSGRTYSLAGNGDLTLNTDNIVWNLISNAQDWTFNTGLTATGNIIDLTADLNDLQNVNTSPSSGSPLYYNAGASEWQANTGVVFTGAGAIRATAGSVGTPSYSFGSDEDTGFYSIAAGEIGVSSEGVLRARFDTSGIRCDSGVIRSTDGSASLPAYTFNNDTNSGFYSSNTDQVALSLGGSLHTAWDVSGWTRTLDGSAATPAYSFLNDGNTGMYRPNSDRIGFSVNGGLILDISSTGLRSNVSGSATNPAYSFFGDENMGMFRAGADELAFSTAGAEAMRINASGNVGIGDSDPGYPLEVARNQEDLLSLKHTGSGEWVFGVTADNSLSIGDVAEKHVYIDTSGNVGIGTSSPGDNLHIASSLPTIRLEDSDVAAGASYGLIYSSSNGSIVLSADESNARSSSTIEFVMDGSEAARIDSSGNLLVGKTATNTGTAGIECRADGRFVVTRDSSAPVTINRLTTDGDLFNFLKDGTVCGTIETISGLTMAIDGGTGFTGLQFASSAIVPRDSGATANGTVDLGTSSARFNNGYFGGDIAIGDGSTSYRLHVSDATSPQIGITDTTNNATFYAGALDTSVILGSDSNHDVRIAANSSEVARFTASGGRLQLVNGGTAADPLIRTTGDTDTGLFWPNGNALGFAIGGTEAARFDSNGAFRVGDGAAATPTFTFNSDPDTGMFLDGTVLAFSFGGTRRLSVDGDRVLFETQMRGLGGSATTPDYSFNNDSDTGMYRSTTNELSFSTAGLRRFYINSNGHILNPSHNTTANSANAVIDAATGVISRSTSSKRYKQDIHSLTEKLSSKLYEIEAVTYRSSIEGDDQEKVHLGFIAEQLDEIGLPELVNYHDHGEGLIPESVNYERATVLLINELKKQKESMTNLEARLAKLEALMENK